MHNHDLIAIQNELIKRHSFAYSWEKKQNNEWDNLTNFIYTIKKFEELKIALSAHLYHHPDFKELCYYAMNRWYNFISAAAIERIFCNHDGVIAHQNIKHKEIDFYIQNIPFDHKTSVFPVGLKKDYEWAKNHKKELIEWLYINQSDQQRHHQKNRIFILLYNSSGAHWQLKSELLLIKQKVAHYLNHWNTQNLCTLNFNNETVLSDIIWIDNIKTAI